LTSFYFDNKIINNHYLWILIKIIFLLISSYGDWGLGIWGLGIGDWAQSPIPNPQSPIPNPQSPWYFYCPYIIINNYLSF
jgi:hypothetical protein